MEEFFDPNEPDMSNGEYFCRLCLVPANSEKLWMSHIGGKRHIKNVMKYPNGLPKRNFEEPIDDSYDMPAKYGRYEDDNQWGDYNHRPYDEGYYPRKMDYVKPVHVIDYGHQKAPETILPSNSKIFHDTPVKEKLDPISEIFSDQNMLEALKKSFEEKPSKNQADGKLLKKESLCDEDFEKELDELLQNSSDSTDLKQNEKLFNQNNFENKINNIFKGKSVDSQPVKAKSKEGKDVEIITIDDKSTSIKSRETEVPVRGILKTKKVEDKEEKVKDSNKRCKRKEDEDFVDIFHKMNDKRLFEVSDEDESEPSSPERKSPERKAPERKSPKKELPKRYDLKRLSKEDSPKRYDPDKRSLKDDSSRHDAYKRPLKDDSPRHYNSGKRFAKENGPKRYDSGRRFVREDSPKADRNRRFSKEDSPKRDSDRRFLKEGSPRRYNPGKRFSKENSPIRYNSDKRFSKEVSPKCDDLSKRFSKDDSPKYYDLDKRSTKRDISTVDYSSKRSSKEESPVLEDSIKRFTKKDSSKLDDIDPEILTPDLVDNLLSSYMKTDSSKESADSLKKKDDVEDDNLDNIEEKLDKLPTKAFFEIVVKRLAKTEIKDKEELEVMLNVISQVQAVVCKKLPPNIQAVLKSKMSQKDSKTISASVQKPSLPVANPVPIVPTFPTVPQFLPQPVVYNVPPPIMPIMPVVPHFSQPIASTLAQPVASIVPQYTGSSTSQPVVTSISQPVASSVQKPSLPAKMKSQPVPSSTITKSPASSASDSLQSMLAWQNFLSSQDSSQTVSAKPALKGLDSIQAIIAYQNYLSALQAKAQTDPKVISQTRNPPRTEASSNSRTPSETKSRSSSSSETKSRSSSSAVPKSTASTAPVKSSSNTSSSFQDHMDDFQNFLSFVKEVTSKTASSSSGKLESPKSSSQTASKKLDIFELPQTASQRDSHNSSKYESQRTASQAKLNSYRKPESSNFASHSMHNSSTKSVSSSPQSKSSDQNINSASHTISRAAVNYSSSVSNQAAFKNQQTSKSLNHPRYFMHFNKPQVPLKNFNALQSTSKPPSK